ncbi:MAG: urease accessory protein UreF [Nodosilinea sp.]
MPMSTTLPIATTNAQALLKLLQLVSPALPVGAYSYSEGLETLVHQGVITNVEAMAAWLCQELSYGLVRLEVAVIGQVHQAATAGDEDAISRWNHWLSALRDTEETRQQSWAMGRALVRMATDLHPDLGDRFAAVGSRCNFAVGFGLLAVHWEISAPTTALGYLHSWTTNAVTSAVKLIPLGQTAGQRLMLELYPTLAAAAVDGLKTMPEDFSLSGWGAALASMQHEGLYSRLFRS